MTSDQSVPFPYPGFLSLRGRNRIGLNIGSMLPWSAVPVVGLPLATWITRRAGYAFWQVLPFRSVTVDGLKRAGIPVRFAEPAWNATTFRDYFQRRLGAEGGHTKLQDPLFFPDPQECARIFKRVVGYFAAQPIYHNIEVGRDGLVEVHLGLEKSIRDLAILAEKNPSVRFVIDLKYLRSMGPVPWWDSSETALEVLLPFTNLLHVQAINTEEWRDFIKGKPTKLAEMLRFIRDWGYAGPFVVEFDPRATGLSGLFPWVLAKNLRRVRERVEEQLEGRKQNDHS